MPIQKQKADPKAILMDFAGQPKFFRLVFSLISARHWQLRRQVLPK